MDLAPDIEQFVRLRFQRDQFHEVVETLQSHAVSTPRVMRAVLFLANGSVAMLKHFVCEAEVDVRPILLDAEYVTGISEAPMFLRSMAEPFSDKENLGPARCTKKASKDESLAGVNRTENNESRYQGISGLVFFLGDAQYTAIENQSSSSHIKCVRQQSQSISVVHLPLVFVLEQIAESVEITPVEFTTA